MPTEQVRRNCNRGRSLHRRSEYCNSTNEDQHHRVSRKLPSFSLGPEAEETPIPGLGCATDGRMAKVGS